MGSIFGRQIVLLLTNKSGGALAAGDVVVVDTGNNTAVTTTTSAGSTGGVGIAQEAIANNAIGRILIGGYAALVNVNASVTRGNFGKTHTVAKQATDAGASRTTGTFCQFLTGGTTPTALIFPADLGGGGLTDPTTTRGDLITRGVAALARLAIGAAGKVLGSDGTDPAWGYPPGYQFDYVEFTGAATSITATTEATANTIVTANGVAFDGSTAVMIEFFAFAARPEGTAAAILSYYLYDGSSSIGRIGAHSTPASSNNYVPTILRRKLTPSAATHTYSIRAATSSGTGIVLAGAGGAAADVPGYIRITKV